MPPELLSLSREELADLIVAGRREIAALNNQLSESEKMLKFLHEKMFRPKSEKTPYVERDGVQLTLFSTPVEQHSETPATGEAEKDEPEQINVPAHTREKVKKGHGRKAVSRELQTEERIIHAQPEDKIGPNGEALVLLGYEESRKIDLIPSILRCLIIKREIWGWPDTREVAFTAPVEPCLIPKGKATDAFIIDVLINKFQLGLPLYRQMSALNARGADINASWMSDLVKQAASVFTPVYQAIREQLLRERIVYVDETPIKQCFNTLRLTDEEKARGKTIWKKDIHTGYYWAWLGGNPDTSQCYFHYAPTRGQSAVRDVLDIPSDDLPWEKNNCIALLMCDGYAAYNIISNQPMHDDESRIVRISCWAHVRRAFKECADMGNTHAGEIVALINDIYRVERDARKENDKKKRTSEESLAHILAQREKITAPIIDSIKKLLDQYRPHYTPQSNFRKAIDYTLNLWENLTVFLHHADAPIDNNAAERAIRPLAVGRKNWLFVGSEDAGTWSALFFSLIESCRLQKIDPRAYFHHITPILVRGGKIDCHALNPLALKNTLRAKT
jgi:transposase